MDITSADGPILGQAGADAAPGKVDLADGSRIRAGDALQICLAQGFETQAQESGLALLRDVDVGARVGATRQQSRPVLLDL